MADSIEEVVYTFLTSDTEIMAAFSGVYWMEADSTVYPYLNYWLVDDNGSKRNLNKLQQGEARIQFDIWDDSKIRGVRNRALVRDKVDAISKLIDGFYVVTAGVNEQTIPRESETDPYHFVVDGVIQWREE